MSANRLPPAEAASGRPYVLLVEEEVEDEALAQRILKKYRIANQVDWVKDGEDAYRLLQQRLSPAAPGSGRTPGETSQVMARARLQEGAAGASLLPGQDAGTRVPAPDPGRASYARAANGLSSASESRPGSRAPEMILLSCRPDPKVTPLEQIRRLRTLPGMENVPIAFCCRTPEEEKPIREAAPHRVACLSKPIGFFKLLECIQKMDMHWFVFSEKP